MRQGVALLQVPLLAACSWGAAGTVSGLQLDVAEESAPVSVAELTAVNASAVTGSSLNGVPAESVALQKDSSAPPAMVLKTFNSRDQYLPAQVEFLNGLLRFDKMVTVLTEVEEGPLFDPQAQEIWMPSSFVNDIESHFGQEDAPVGDVYLHTLVHEVGHVLFSQYDLPLLAREEDAADALASVLLLEYADDGARVVLNAARMFGLESEKFQGIEKADFWSEHSLDIQRYYTTLCHVYGSDPEAQAQLINGQGGLSEERAENCVTEYKRLRHGWLDVLEPYLKR